MEDDDPATWLPASSPTPPPPPPPPPGPPLNVGLPPCRKNGLDRLVPHPSIHADPYSFSNVMSVSRNGSLPSGGLRCAAAPPLSRAPPPPPGTAAADPAADVAAPAAPALAAPRPVVRCWRGCRRSVCKQSLLINPSIDQSNDPSIDQPLNPPIKPMRPRPTQAKPTYPPAVGLDGGAPAGGGWWSKRTGGRPSITLGMDEKRCRWTPATWDGVDSALAAATAASASESRLPPLPPSPSSPLLPPEVSLSSAPPPLPCWPLLRGLGIAPPGGPDGPNRCCWPLPLPSPPTSA